MPTQTKTNSAPSSASATSSVNEAARALRASSSSRPGSWIGTSPRAQRLDPLRDDVADDDVVAELGEARARDEPDVAGAEDRDPRHARRLAYRRGSGFRPLAIAIIVSFESESSSVFTTQ